MRTRTRFLLDAALAATLLVAYRPSWTGITLHEWLGIAIIAPLLLHLFINWDWALRIVRTFVARLLSASRLNFVIDCGLMIATVTVTVSGFMVSSLFGIHASNPLAWHVVHLWTANITLTLLGIHAALHWRWIWAAAKRLAEPRSTARTAAAGAAASAQASAQPRVALTTEERRARRRQRAAAKAAAERATLVRAASLLGVTATLGLAVLAGVGLASPLLASAAAPRGSATTQTCPKTGCKASRCHAAYGKRAADFYHLHTASPGRGTAKTHRSSARRTAAKRAASVKVTTTRKRTAAKTATTKAKAATKPSAVTKRPAATKKSAVRTYTCPATGCTASSCHGTHHQSASTYYQ